MATARKKSAKKKTAKKAAKKGKPVPRIKPRSSRPKNDAAAEKWLEDDGGRSGAGEGKRKRGRPKNEVEKASLHAYIPATLHRAARIRALEEGRPLSKLVEQAISDHLGIEFDP